MGALRSSPSPNGTTRAESATADLEEAHHHEEPSTPGNRGSEPHTHDGDGEGGGTAEEAEQQSDDDIPLTGSAKKKRTRTQRRNEKLVCRWMDTRGRVMPFEKTFRRGTACFLFQHKHSLQVPALCFPLQCGRRAPQPFRGEYSSPTHDLLGTAV